MKLGKIMIESNSLITDAHKFRQTEELKPGTEVIKKFPDEVSLLISERGDDKPGPQKVMDRVRGFTDTGELAEPIIDFSDAIAIYSTAILENPTDTDYPNNVLRHIEETLSSVFYAFKRVDRNDNESFKTALLQLTLFMERFGKQQIKWGLPLNSDGGDADKKIKLLKESLLDSIDHSLSDDDREFVHATIFKKILNKFYFQFMNSNQYFYWTSKI
jgi:hypothetical protein